MKQSIVFPVFALLAAVGCARGAPVAKPPTPIVQAEAAPTVTPSAVEPTVSVTPPDGWLSIPDEMLPANLAGDFYNLKMKARIFVVMKSSDQSAAADAAAFAQMLREKRGVATDEIQTAKDGMSASFSASKEDFGGFVTVRHAGPDGHLSLTFVGNWPKTNAEKAKADYDALVRSVEIE
jgi:hypothetical protein